MTYKKGLLLCSIFFALSVGGCNLSATRNEPSIACEPEALIDAINAANDTPSTEGVIVLNGGCTYEYNAPYENNPPSTYAALPLITSPIEIQGNGAVLNIFSTWDEPLLRGFFVPAGGSLALHELTMVTHSFWDAPSSVWGPDYGGMIRNQGTTILHDSLIEFAYAENGGAISNNGVLELHRTEIQDGFAATGGGIYNYGDGQVTLHDSTLTRCNADAWHNSGGGIYSQSDGEVVIEGSLFDHNTSGGRGGALQVLGDLVISGSQFHGNSSSDYGGAIYQWEGDLTIHGSRFVGNHSDIAGAVMVSTTGYQARPDVIIDTTEFSMNDADEEGSALYVKGGYQQTLVENCTFSHNVGSSVIYNMGQLRIRFTTVAENPGSVGVVSESPYGIAIENSIIANNGTDCSIPFFMDAVGANLRSDGSCSGFTITADPLLEPLGDFGGPTQTHALGPGSPARDRALGDCPSVDQRLVGRPSGAGCDLGAYEVELPYTYEQAMDEPLELVTPQPPMLDEPHHTGRIIDTVPCFKGPSPDYPVVSALKPGAVVEVVGISEDGDYIVIYNPCYPLVACWVDDSALKIFGSIDTLEEMAAPPLEPLPEEPQKPDGGQACHSGLSEEACIAAGGTYSDPPGASGECICPD
jgi:predicted outer membrane repeat protein